MDTLRWEALKAPFPEKDMEWRIMRSGKSQKGIWAMCLTYVTNRAIMDRLDEAIGEHNWKNEFMPLPSGGILCGISIKVGDEWITKWDGAENTAVEAVKGGISGAMKRSAVQWGIGRYLYHLEEGFADITDRGKFKSMVSAKNNKVDRKDEYFKWNPPILPSWALPKEDVLDVEDILIKINEVKAFTHLKNVWGKYGSKFTGEDLERLIKAKDKKKEEFDA